MQKIEGKCTACGGDGVREVVGVACTTRMVFVKPPLCTHCHGSGMEPEPRADEIATFLRR